ncbi:MAG: nucleotidyltransferase domain-containing protein [Candidatus Njordarchaeales archaeon]
MAEELIDVLRKLKKILDRENVNWVLAGPLAAKTLGLSLSTKAIDILTDEEGVYIMSRLFQNSFQTIVPADFRKVGNILAHFGVFNADGVPVNIIGNPVINFHGYLIKIDVKDVIAIATSVKINDETYLVPPLEWLLVYFKLITQDDNIMKKLAGFIQETDFNKELLERILQNFPSVLKDELIQYLEPSLK